ncbi:hypothetical protein HYT56_03920 [Candidatus Woesearchaeota archaeon]|nr:hypothetical protein [Candidatus Woesearchaeota archaeon]
MSIFKKPPDVGKEPTEIKVDKEEGTVADDYIEDGEDVEDVEEYPKSTSRAQNISRAQSNFNSSSGIFSPVFQADLERIKMQLQAMETMRDADNQRFNRLNEQIGELRSMIINNEKEIKDARVAATKASDILGAIHPEQLAIELQKKEAKIETLRAKIESNEEISNTILEEMKEMRRHIELFRGSEGILKLNEEIKNDLIQTQKIKSIVESRADKAEQIFIQLQKEFTDVQKLDSLIKETKDSISKVDSEVEEIKIRLESFANKDEIESLRESSLEFSGKKQDFADKREIEDVMIRINEIEKNIGTLAQLNDTVAESIEKIRRRESEADTSVDLLKNKLDKNMKIIGDILDGLNRKLSSGSGRKIKDGKEIKEFYKEGNNINPIDLTKHLPKLLKRFKIKKEQELARVSNYMKKNAERQVTGKVEQNANEEAEENRNELNEEEFSERTEDLNESVKNLSKPFPKIETEKVKILQENELKNKSNSKRKKFENIKVMDSKLKSDKTKNRPRIKLSSNTAKGIDKISSKMKSRKK